MNKYKKKLKTLKSQNTEKPQKSGTFSIKAFGTEIQAEGYVIWGVLGVLALYVYLKWGHKTIKRKIRRRK